MSRGTIKVWTTHIMAILAIPLAAVACEDSPTGAEGTARVSTYLTDAPGDVESAWIQIEDIVLIGGEGQVSLLEEGHSDWIELVSLQDDAMSLSEDVEVEAGTYTQVRFIVSSAVLVVEDGETYSFGDAEPPEGVEPTGTLICPSCSQTGIKVRLPGGVELEEGDDAGILMDFDVSQSFGRQAGQSGNWVMHPVILGTAADAADIEDDAVDSEIGGTVTLAGDLNVPVCDGEARSIEDFVPTATATTLEDDDGNLLAFTGEVDADGEFELEVLGADTWTLGYESETEFESEKLVWEADVSPAEVVIEMEGDSADGVEYTVTAVSCDPVA